MIKYIAIAMMLLASITHAHDNWVDGSTDRGHLEGTDLKGYIHGHIETVDGVESKFFWDVDPAAPNQMQQTEESWEKTGCKTEDGLYDHDCHKEQIEAGKLNPVVIEPETDDPKKKKPKPKPINPPGGDDTTTEDGNTSIEDDNTGNEDETEIEGGLIGPGSIGGVNIPPPPRATSNNLLITEYMMRDGGAAMLPTWVELHNNNNQEISLNGYTFTWATKKFANLPWSYHTHTIQNFSIPANGTALLVSKLARESQQSGIDQGQVYSLNIREGRNLKAGWKISNAEGYTVYCVGQAFNKGGPVLPGGWNERKAYERYPSTDSPTERYYGRDNDIGSPGFYKATAAAPSIKRIKYGLWANERKGK